MIERKGRPLAALSAQSDVRLSFPLEEFLPILLEKSVLLQPRDVGEVRLDRDPDGQIRHPPFGVFRHPLVHHPPHHDHGYQSQEGNHLFAHFAHSSLLFLPYTQTAILSSQLLILSIY